MRRLAQALGLLLFLYAITWWPGVSLVRVQLRDAEIAEFKAYGRELLEVHEPELKPDVLVAKLAVLDRDAEALKVEIHRVIPVFPALIWAHYSMWGLAGPSTTIRRVVVWYGPGVRFWSYVHYGEFYAGEFPGWNRK